MTRKGEKSLWDLDWQERPTEVDIVSMPESMLNSYERRAEMELLKLKVNLVNVTPAQFVQYLGGKRSQAEYIVLNCHGDPDHGNRCRGFALHGNYRSFRIPSWDKPIKDLLPTESLDGWVKIPGKVVISQACGSGRVNMARVFLKGGAKAYIGPSQAIDVEAGENFIKNFLYEMIVNHATIPQALTRARASDGMVGLFRLFTADRLPASDPELPKFVDMRAPCLLDDFSGKSDNWITCAISSINNTWVPGPGGRDGRALLYSFDLKKNPDSWFQVGFTPLHKWIGAKGLAFDIYVPIDMPLKKPLEIWVHLVSNKKRVSRWFVPRIKLDRGWNEIRIPFDSRKWMREGETNCVGKPSRPDLKKLAPLRYVSFRMTSRDPKASAVVYLSNLRLE